MSVIDEYLSQVAPDEKTELERIRRIVRHAVPEVAEVISYGMPVLKYNGKYLIGFAAFKDHMSVFPGSMPVDQLKDKLHDYKTSKGTIQFTVEKPLSEALIKELVDVSLAGIRNT